MFILSRLPLPSDIVILARLTSMLSAAQAKAPEQSTSTARAGADSITSPGSTERRYGESIDLGYSLVSGSSTFTGLQEVGTLYLRDILKLADRKEILGNDEFRNITVAHNDAPQSMLPQRDVEALITKLPPRTVVGSLVDFFFDEVNWHYFILERFYFDSLLTRWPPAEEVEAVNYLTSAELSMELRYFPALLFQVLALSLQFLPTDCDILVKLRETIDFAPETYSDIGDELLSQLGRPGLALTAIQADFLRSSWLKNCGRGIESWHTVGSAIRFVRS